MLFPTITFAIFFLVVYAASWLLMPRLRLWKWFIIAASYVFYGWWDWRFVLLLVAATFVNQALGGADRRARGRSGVARAGRGWLVAAIVVNLAALGYFKYFDFFASSLDDLLGRFGLGAPLPLLRVRAAGRHLVPRLPHAHVRWSTSTAASSSPASTLDFGVYVAFFPYLLAGPIARAGEFLPQLRSPRDPHTVDAGRAFVLILGGLAKKMLIADYLATHIVNGVFSSPQSVLVVGDAGGHRRLLGADLLRLQRLQRHRHRRRPAARLRAPRQLQRALRGAHASRTSGAAGTSRSRAGCATTCTSRWAATARAAGAPT